MIIPDLKTSSSHFIVLQFFHSDDCSHEQDRDGVTVILLHGTGS
jgi:hypothetical protein